MSQVKIYGHRAFLTDQRTALSDAIQSALSEGIGLPAGKRFHRFLPLEPEDFIHPPDRSGRYIIIEISMFAGRSEDAKRALLRLLIERVSTACGIDPTDIEITIFETPRANWGIRGLPGDELELSYRVDT